MQQLFSPLVERAMRVAAYRHRNQNRKASGLPYISHPCSVALILMKAEFDDEEIIAAALLHDVVEDTDYSMEALEEEFPTRVAEYVAVLTERKTESDGTKRNWQDRKDEHLESVARAPLEARAIVLADKLHNLGTMLYDLEAGEEIWSRFSAPQEKILWYHRAMIKNAAGNDERLNQLAQACGEMLSRLEAIIEAE
jgi:(p)ppGpp synthase/HD superfamily hydrolase